MRFGRSSRGTRPWSQRLVLLFNACFIVGLLVIAGGLGYGYAKYSRLPRIEVGSVLSTESSSTTPQNFLLVGVDSATSLAPDDPAAAGRGDVGGLRSDTMMVLRVNPTTREAILLSLPRDLWVPLASGGTQRLNTAIQIGGPENLIDTIEQYLSIPINHYVQVDFAGFKGLVDALGGVKVYFATPVRDGNSGLDIKEPGCIALDPTQALGYVRSRHYEYYENGRWRSDPTSDLGRVNRQQDFIVRAVRRAIEKGVRNPVSLDRLVDAGLKTVTVDETLVASDIVSLAAAFRSFDPDGLGTYTLPVRGDSVGGASVLRLIANEAQPILALFRGAPSGAATPGDVRVQVLNGTGRSGEAGLVSKALGAVGFGIAGTGDEGGAVAHTIVRFQAGQQAAADLVARYLDADVEFQVVTEALPADVVVVSGFDYLGVRSTPRPPSPSTSTPVGSAPATDTALPTTSTSIVGKVPEPPPEANC